MTKKKIQYSLKATVDAIKKVYRSKKVYKKNIADDIRALKKEFEDVKISTKEISVVTEPIILEGRNFGRFKINWEYSRSRWDIRLEALEPLANPWDAFRKFIERRDDFYYTYPHPHIEGNHLCLGDGDEAFFAAWTQGRIFDFFLIVSTILKNYAPINAHRRVEKWNKTTRCCKCGKEADILKDIYKCTDCGITVCRSCMDFTCKDDNCRFGLCHRCNTMYQKTPKKVHRCHRGHGNMLKKQVRKKKIVKKKKKVVKKKAAKKKKIKRGRKR